VAGGDVDVASSRWRSSRWRRRRGGTLVVVVVVSSSSSPLTWRSRPRRGVLILVASSKLGGLASSLAPSYSPSLAFSLAAPSSPSLASSSSSGLAFVRLSWGL
jgi:hypothetical protein